MTRQELFPNIFFALDKKLLGMFFFYKKMTLINSSYIRGRVQKCAVTEKHRHNTINNCNKFFLLDLFFKNEKKTPLNVTRDKKSYD